MRALLRSPVREFCTPGSVRGLSGNWQFYLNGFRAVSEHPINPILRVAIALLRWPLILYPALMALSGVGHAHYAVPLQKQFYRPIFAALWAILALLPFALIRRRIPFLFYCMAFCAVGGWMVFDLVVPFRYVAPDFQGVIDDPGGSYAIRGSSEQGYDYWITRFTSERWLFLAFLVWPFLLGCVYHLFYVRGQRIA